MSHVNPPLYLLGMIFHVISKKNDKAEPTSGLSFGSSAVY
jgi:hypothetical protein